MMNITFLARFGVCLPAVFLFLSFFQTTLFATGVLRFQSGQNRVALIELYTSQGCSSCPPADEWLSELRNKPGLWKKFVPVAFHVDYWDYIGWKDPFAEKAFSQRQRMMRQTGNLSSVYTPGFLINGEEWRRWFTDPTFPELKPENAANLSAELAGKTLRLLFEQETRNVRFHYAILGFDLKTAVHRGENAYKTLKDDFVVLGYSSGIGKNSQWRTELNLNNPSRTQKYALAVWVTRNRQNTPLQTAGAWLPENFSQRFGGNR